MEGFAGKIAVVTGGSQGIGLAVVRQLSVLGAVVATCGRNREKWDVAQSAFPEVAEADFYQVDLTDRKALGAWFAYLRDRFATLDLAVNSASSQVNATGPFSAIPEEALLAGIRTDLLVPLWCMREEVGLMSRGASIVNVSSINGLRATPGAAAYSAAKHGLEGMTKSLALEYAEQGIRINAVAPGVTMTARWQQRLALSPVPADLKKNVEQMIPVKRFGTPDEIANAIVWLSSPAASYVVGHTLVVDGGLAQA